MTIVVKVKQEGKTKKEAEKDFAEKIESLAQSEDVTARVQVTKK